MRTFSAIALIFFLLSPLPVAQAQVSSGADTSRVFDSGTDTSEQGVKLINPLNLGPGNCSATNTCLSALLTNILAFVVRIGSIVVILMLVYIGFKFVTAQGSDTKITEAKQMLLWTVVGALILLGAQAISMGIQATVQALSVGG